MYIESRPYGLAGKGFHGGIILHRPNPPFGATFTYYLKDGLKTRAEIEERERKGGVKKGETPPYPTYDELRREDEEEPPSITFTVTDESGKPSENHGPVSKGFNRVALGSPVFRLTPARLKDPEPDLFAPGDESPLAMPGTYSVTMSKRVEGVTTGIAGPVTFSASVLSNSSLPAPDRKALLEFQKSVASLQRAVLGASRAADELKGRIALIRKALSDVQAPRRACAEMSILSTPPYGR